MGSGLVRLGSLLAVVSVVGVGCGGSSSEDQAETPSLVKELAGETAPPSDAEAGGDLSVLASSDVDYVDPGAVYYQFGYMVTNATQRTLLGWAPDDTVEPSPDLAAEAPVFADDGKTVTFTLRPGVRFSPPVDREVTSADVKYAIERGLLPGVANGYEQIYLADLIGFERAVEQARRNPSVAPDISGIETPDDRTLVLRLDRPTAATAAQSLSLPISAPVPEEYAREFDADNPSTYADHVVATGPYMIENNSAGEAIGYTPGKQISLVRNPNWDPETDFRPAFVNSVTIREGYADTAIASRKILNGESEINGDFNAPPNVLKDTVDERPDQFGLASGGGVSYISLNTAIPPFDDLNVRRAVLAATNRDELRDQRGGELLGEVASHYIPPDIPGFEEAGGIDGPDLDFLANPEGDLELAADYMRRAGYESGRYEGDAHVLVLSANSGTSPNVAQIFTDTLKKLGFDVDLQLVSANVMLTRFCTVPKARVEVCPSLVWGKDFNDAQTILNPLFNGRYIVPENNANTSQLDDPAINRAMDEAALLTGAQERAQAWGEIDRMVSAQAPAVPWTWPRSANIASADVNGVVNLFNGSWDLSATSLDQ